MSSSSPCRDAGDPSLPEDPDETIADQGAIPYLPSPQINASPSPILFGEVLCGEEVERTLTISNVGEETLVIYDVYDSSLCYSNNYDPADSILAPGEELNIAIFFVPLEAIPYIETLTIDNNDEQLDVMLLGVGIALGVTDPEQSGKPDQFMLLAPYPNPFNPETNLTFALPIASDISLVVYDAQGCNVTMLANGFYAAGYHQVRLDGNGIPSGIYFARLIAGDFEATQRLMLIK